MSQFGYDNILSSIDKPTTPQPTISNAPTNEEIINGHEINIENVISPVITEHTLPKKLFDINQFVEEVKQKNEQIAKYRNQNTVRINSYSIAHDCIRQVIFQILNYPAASYSGYYLPIRLKSTLGNAVHDFIQSNTSVFTELETSVKVPSIRVSCRMDALINDDVIVEIKSCTFKDFDIILRQKKPRDADFLQVVLYKYLLENHLEEAKQQTSLRTKPPKLDKYNIKYFQFIYVANDVLSSDASNVSEALNDVTKVKKMLNSKYNQFYFISPITIDLSTFDITSHYNWIINKINAINYYLNNNKIPPLDDPFIMNNCFFCIYKDICNQYK